MTKPPHAKDGESVSPRAAPATYPETMPDLAWTQEARPSSILTIRRLMLVPAIGIVVLTGCMFFDEIDGCLDRGGRWNDTTEACEFHQQSPNGKPAGEAQSR